MPPRLKSVIAVWFVLQIILPFTAPLQTLALGDLLPTQHHSSTALPHESSATPLPVAAAGSFAASQSFALPASISLAFAPRVALRGSLTSIVDVSPAPIRQTVLRL
jgi:biopolymer transport protein ExbD